MSARQSQRRRWAAAQCTSWAAARCVAAAALCWPPALWPWTATAARTHGAAQWANCTLSAAAMFPARHATQSRNESQSISSSASSRLSPSSASQSPFPIWCTTLPRAQAHKKFKGISTMPFANFTSTFSLPHPQKRQLVIPPTYLFTSLSSTLATTSTSSIPTRDSACAAPDSPAPPHKEISSSSEEEY